MTAATAMTGAELKVAREWLGLTTRWLADHLDVAERTVHRWEMGVSTIPDGVRTEVGRLDAETADVVAQIVRMCGNPDVVDLTTYRTDAEYRGHHPEQTWPASWHRVAVARAVHELPDLLPIRYRGLA